MILSCFKMINHVIFKHQRILQKQVEVCSTLCFCVDGATSNNLPLFSAQYFKIFYIFCLITFYKFFKLVELGERGIIFILPPKTFWQISRVKLPIKHNITLHLIGTTIVRRLCIQTWWFGCTEMKRLTILTAWLVKT